jgi:hypothetical protein
MSSLDPMRIAEAEAASELGRGIRAMRAIDGDAQAVSALSARLSAELAAPTALGSAALPLSALLLRIALLSAALLGLGVAALKLSESPTQPSRLARPTLGSTSAPALEPPRVASVVAPTLAPEIEAPTQPAVHKAPARKDKRVSTSDAEAELALLGRAQALLGRDAHGTLALLAEHTRSYPRGVFREEREVLALEAESKLGRKAAAVARAERFVAEFPRSAHARRVRSLLEP